MVKSSSTCPGHRSSIPFSILAIIKVICTVPSSSMLGDRASSKRAAVNASCDIAGESRGARRINVCKTVLWYGRDVATRSHHVFTRYRGDNGAPIANIIMIISRVFASSMRTGNSVLLRRRRTLHVRHGRPDLSLFHTIPGGVGKC